MRPLSSLSPSQRAALVALGAVELALLAATLVDLQRRPAEQVNGSKLAWRLAAFVNVLGPVSYFVFGRRR